MLTAYAIFQTLLLIASALGIFLLLKNSKQSDSDKKTEFQIQALQNNLEKLERSFREQLAQGRHEQGEQSKSQREEISKSVNEFSQIMFQQLKGLTDMNTTKLESIRTVVEKKLTELQTDNSQKLEQMRATVEEKLQGTLEKRLGESFKLVSDRLELVHKGLGEMQTLAVGVGDLKKVLSNVKSRGTWGEIQLGPLLEQILSPEQYDKNVRTKPRSLEVVEFAVKMPGRSSEVDAPPVWLPIDSKFPHEDYLRLVDAQERADPEAAEVAGKALEERIKQSARDIQSKYLSPPNTTDFGVMFLPTESLYAETLRRPGLVEQLQSKYRIVVAGPTTLAALLNSLQMGFRTMAIEKRSSEVWQLLGAIKTEFGRFGEILDKVQKKLHEASNTIDDASSKSRNIEQRLKKVEQMPTEIAQSLLGTVENNPPL
jgi:DNA recombination protein RmuC